MIELASSLAEKRNTKVWFYTLLLLNPRKTKIQRIISGKTEGPTRLPGRSLWWNRDVHMKMQTRAAKNFPRKGMRSGGDDLGGKRNYSLRDGRPQTRRRGGQKGRAWHLDRKHRERTDRKSGFCEPWTSICKRIGSNFKLLVAEQRLSERIQSHLSYRSLFTECFVKATRTHLFLVKR